MKSGLVYNGCLLLSIAMKCFSLSAIPKLVGEEGPIHMYIPWVPQ